MRQLLAALLLCFFSAVAFTPQAKANVGDQWDLLKIPVKAEKVKKAKHVKGKHRRKPVTMTALEARPVFRDQGMRRLQLASAADETGFIQGIARLPMALLDRARQYLGKNPTGWGSLWCGRFMAMIAPEAARRLGNPNWARDWAELPHVAPRVGAIVVLARGRKGGHVGVVADFDRRGNPIVISGNHGHRVGKGVYPKSRVIAYVSAS